MIQENETKATGPVKITIQSGITILVDYSTGTVRLAIPSKLSEKVTMDGMKSFGKRMEQVAL